MIGPIAATIAAVAATVVEKLADEIIDIVKESSSKAGARRKIIIRAKRRAIELVYEEARKELKL